MKKTLLIAVAALAAGITSIQAQAVYSQNIVGYYNITIPAGKFVLAASQLNLDNTNSINNIFSGLASDANGSTNTAIWLWNPGTQQYSSYKYYLGPDADNYFLNSGSVNGFYDSGGTLISVAPPVGNGFFIQHSGPAETWTNIFKVN